MTPSVRQLVVLDDGSSFPLPGFEFDLNLDDDLYYGATLDDFTFSRGNNAATDLLFLDPPGAPFNTYLHDVLRRKTSPTGKRPALLEVGPCNQYISSPLAPASQTSSALPIGPANFWMNGTGSCQLTDGGGTGDTTISFTNGGLCTGGNPVYVTVAGTTGSHAAAIATSGNVNAFQLADLAWPTSLINGASRGNETWNKTTFPNVNGALTLRTEGTPLEPDLLNPNPATILTFDAGVNTATAAANRMANFRRVTAGQQLARGVNSHNGGASSPDLGNDIWPFNTRGAICLTSMDGAQFEAFNGGAVSSGTDLFPVGMITWRNACSFNSTSIHWNGLIHRLSASLSFRTAQQTQQISRLTGTN